MALDTKNIKAGGDGGVPKTLQPGNCKCKINSIMLEEFKFKPGSYHIILGLESEDKGADFEGFMIDKNNESLGRHKGQVGKVKSTEWAYADGETKSGVAISRDADILKFMKNLCTALGINNWLEDQDGKHDTIESLMLAFDKDKPFKDKFINYCIGGKEYTNKNGYTDHDLFLPKYSKAGAAYGAKVVTFDPVEHIRKKKAAPVNEFGNDDTTLSGPAAGDFQLD